MRDDRRTWRTWVLLPALLLGLLPLTVAATAADDEPLDRVVDPTDACPDDTNPPSPFTDRARISSVHVLNVDCAYNNRIALGSNDGRFRPRDAVRRDEFASFLVRTLRAADVTLPAPTDQGFRDIRGNVHADNINILAQTGIALGRTSTRYAPAGNLTRAQTATFVLRAAAYLQDIPISSIQRETGPFTDVPSEGEHYRNINGAAHFRLTVGRTATTYEPNRNATREQMASFLIRLLASLRDGPLIPPEEIVEEVEIPLAVAVNPVGTDHTVEARALDINGDPVRDARLRFEVFRHDEPVLTDPAFAFLAPAGFATTDANGIARYTYSGPAAAADDRIAACVVRGPIATTSVDVPVCGNVVDAPDGVGQTVVPTTVVPAAVGQKKWGFLAHRLDGTATGIQGVLLGEDLVATPHSFLALTSAGPTSGSESDELLALPLAPLVDLGVATTSVIGDTDYGIVQSESETADVSLLGGAITAEVIGTTSTNTCEPSIDGFASLLGLRIGGNPIDPDIPPNTGVDIPLLAQVWLNELIVDEDANEQIRRGLRVRVLDLPGLPVVQLTLAETTASLDCLTDEERVEFEAMARSIDDPDPEPTMTIENEETERISEELRSTDWDAWAEEHLDR